MRFITLCRTAEASREVAAECYDERRKRDQILFTFNKASKALDAPNCSACSPH